MTLHKAFDGETYYWWDDDRSSALTMTEPTPIEIVRQRLAYIESKDLRNGWSGNESGPCCDRCAMRPEHFTGRAGALKALVGCRNPFQLPEVCQCHIPVRQAVRNGQIEILNQVIRRLEKQS